MNENNKISEEMIINKVIINDDYDNESIDEEENVEYTSDYDIEYDNHSDYDADEKELELYNEMMVYTDNKGCNINDESDNESIQDVNVEYTIYDDIEYDNHSDEDADEKELQLYNEMMLYTNNKECTINDKISDIDDDECHYCDWNSNLPQSHVIHCIYCPIVVSAYDTYIDDDGEIFYTLKSNK